MSEVLELAITGAAGRMGRRLIALAHADPDLKVVTAIDAGAAVGQDAGELAGVGPIGVAITEELLERVDVVIDFSMPDGAEAMAKMCGERQIPLVEATTGLTNEQRQTVLDAGQTTPLVFAPSMSAAVNVGMKLVRDAAHALMAVQDGVDVEIIERHHRFKEDAPSGTALKFGEIVAEQMGQEQHVHGRSGRTGERPRGQIGYHALRVGDNVGEHTIVFGMLGETLEVTVRGQSRDSYAHGALAAAKWVAGQSAGVYGMADVLGLD